MTRNTMRVKSKSTDLLLLIKLSILDVFMGGCSLSFFNAPIAVPTLVPTRISTVTALPTIVPSVQPTVNNNLRPVIGRLIITPSSPSPASPYTLQIKLGQVILSVSSVQNATEVSFFEAPHGTGVTPHLIGTDTNLADGAAVSWTINETSLLNSVWAEARNSNGLETSTEIYTVVYADSIK